MSEHEFCECGEPILDGDLVFNSVDGGFLHADCCDEDSFVDVDTGEPVTAPQPFIYHADV